LFKDKLYGARDQNQIRPLCIAKKDGKNGDSDSYFFVSQSSAIPSLEATRWIREVQMGEVVVLGADGIDKSVRWTERTKSAFCICEPIYSLNPNDTFFGVSAYAFRVKAGEVAARKNRVRADCAVPVPESGRGYIDGFCSESGIPSRDGLIKSRYSLDGGRTFMEDRNVDRGKIQKRKLQANPDVMRGRVVLLVEDSIFRGSVAPASVKMSREHGGAREVHMVVCSPPVCFPCHLGLDTGTSEELVASHMSLSEIRDQKIHSDSLVYLSVAELKQVLKELGLNPDDFCFGCFTGKYPVPPPKRR
jgi:amidophosphoribosyltransferase